MYVILISGRSGSGKSTLARQLSSFFSIPVKPLAEQLRHDLAVMLTSRMRELVGLGLLAEYITAQDLTGSGALREYQPDTMALEAVYRKPTDPNIRLMLVGYSQWVKSFAGPAYWARRLLASAKPPFIVDDLRFIAELDYLWRFSLVQAVPFSIIHIHIMATEELLRARMREHYVPPELEPDVETLGAASDFVWPFDVSDHPQRKSRYFASVAEMIEKANSGALVGRVFEIFGHKAQTQTQAQEA